MITIGIRAEPKGLTFAIYESDEPRVLNVEMIRIPAAFSIPEGLKYLRSNLLDVLREYAVVRAGVRITEPSAQGISIERVQVEGVVQEAFASSMVEGYYVGQISSIAAKLNIDRAELKPLISGERDHPVEGWGDLTPHQREAILCAQGAVYV